MKNLILLLLFVPCLVFGQAKKTNDISLVSPLESNGGVPVNVQDQTTAPFHRYFMTEEKDDITITEAAAKNDTLLILSSGHGFTAGKTILILNGDLSHQTFVTNVTNDTVGFETPLPTALPVSGTQVIRGSVEMNIDGSVTPVVFYCRTGANADPVDIIHLHVFIEDNLEGDNSKYGGIDALTNGSFAQFMNGVTINLGNYKKNLDFIQFGGGQTYTNKAGGGNYSMDFSFDLRETYGVVFRLDPAHNGVIAFTVNDDLTDLISHRVVATGQLTQDE